MNTADGRHPEIQTYLINLNRAPERLSQMAAKLSAAGLTFERVSAVDGKEIVFPTAEFDEAAYTWLHGRRKNPAEVGCYLSHIACARKLLASEADHALILEDDLEFPDDLMDILQAAIDTRRDWDLLRLSSVNGGRKFPVRKMTSKRSLAISLTREKGSGAYLLNRRAARWFVESLVPMYLPFDIAFDLEYRAGLKAAFVHPVPINQDIGLPTQIQGRRRAYHLSRWHYVIIQPYRAWLETTRFGARLARLVALFTRETLGALVCDRRRPPAAHETTAKSSTV